MSIGRGGAGQNKVVFAFLDWVNKSTSKKREQFIAMGGELKPGQRLVDSMWNDVIGNAPKPP